MVDNIYGISKNKYLDNLYLEPKEYGVNWDLVDSKDMVEDGSQWQEQQENCGGHDIRELFNFDITFIEYLYTMLKMYVEYVGKDIDLNYHTFEYQNKKYTQLEAINYICDVLEEALVVHTREENILENVSIRTPLPKRPELPKIDYDKVGDAIALFGKILPAMWW